MENTNNELVNHPSHYNHQGRRECWDEMITYFGKYDVAIFDIVTAYKYYYRAGTKEGNSREQDIAKAHQYLDHAKKLIPDANASEMILSTEIRKHYIFMSELLNDFESSLTQ